MIDQAKYTYTSIGKVFEKQAKIIVYQANVSKSFINKMEKLKSVKVIFQNNQLNSLIRDKLTKILEKQNLFIKTNDLNC